MTDMKIALLQMAATGSMEKNREKGIAFCRKAAMMGADIALFPEMWNIGYTFLDKEAEMKKQAITVDSDFVMTFAHLAKELNMAIGITFLEAHEPKPRNTVCLFDRHGRLQYTYSKVHTCVFGEEVILDAGEDFFVTDLDTAKGFVRVGSMICYDREFPESARILMLKGAELILVPNACPMEINRLSQLRGRAYENMCAIATCNYPIDQPDCNGHSTVFDGVAYLPELENSRDTCILEAGENEGIYMANLDLAMLRGYRDREVHGDTYRRTDCYGILTEVAPLSFCRGTMQDLSEIMNLVKSAVGTMDSQGIMQWDEIYPTEKDFAMDIKLGQLMVGRKKKEIAVVYTINANSDEAYQNGRWEKPDLSYAILHRLCVHPKFQGCGVATRTMQYIEQTMQMQGVQAVRLDVYTRNPMALALYSKCGYQQVGTADWRKGRFFLMEHYLTAH